MSDPWFAHMLQVSGADALRRVPVLWSSASMAMLLCVSLSDMLWRRVSNGLVLSCWLTALCLWAVAFGVPGVAACMLASLGCFVAGLALWSAGTMGAADVKVLAAFAGCVGPGALPSLLLYGALFAGLLGVVALYQPGSHGRGHRVSSMFVACLHPQGALQRARKNGQTMPLTVAFSSSVFVILWGGPQWLV